MFKKKFVSVLLIFSTLMASFSAAEGQMDGYIPVEEGVRVPSTWGVSWEYAGGYAQVFIQDDKFTLLFLDADRKLRRIDNIELAIVHAQSMERKGLFSPFHLQPGSNGLYFQNQRHVYNPHHYRVKLDLRKEVGKVPLNRTKRKKSRFVKDSFDVKLLDQR